MAAVVFTTSDPFIKPGIPNFLIRFHESVKVGDYSSWRMASLRCFTRFSYAVAIIYSRYRVLSIEALQGPTDPQCSAYRKK